MYRRSLVMSFRAVTSLIATGFILSHVGMSPAVAAQLSTTQVSQFVADPSALLKANPNGGGRLVSQIRDLILSDACLPAPAAPRLPACQQALSAITTLLGSANDAQKSAIGIGLGEAAQAVVTTNPTLANDIQTALAQVGDKIALESYQTTVGNQAIAAAGGGGGGGGNNAAYQTLTNTGGGGGGGLQNSQGQNSQGFSISGGSVSQNGNSQGVVSPQ